MIFISLALGAALATAAPDRRRDATLRAFLQREFREESDALGVSRGRGPDIRYAAAFVDLNGDGKQEAVVYLTGRDLCGSGGCDLYIYTPRRGSWREVTALSITRLPVRLLRGRTHGWRDISVFVAGGGILPGYDAQLKFNGRTYPTNPTVPPARPLRKGIPGQVLIGRQDKFLPLF